MWAGRDGGCQVRNSMHPRQMHASRVHTEMVSCRKNTKTADIFLYVPYRCALLCWFYYFCVYVFAEAWAKWPLLALKCNAISIVSLLVCQISWANNDMYQKRIVLTNKRIIYTIHTLVHSIQCILVLFLSFVSFIWMTTSLCLAEYIQFCHFSWPLTFVILLNERTKK